MDGPLLLTGVALIILLLSWADIASMSFQFLVRNVYTSSQFIIKTIYDNIGGVIKGRDCGNQELMVNGGTQNRKCFRLVANSIRISCSVLTLFFCFCSSNCL